MTNKNAILSRDRSRPIAETEQDFDKLANELGDFGKYQIIMYLLGCTVALIAGLNAVTTVFTAYDSPHRCKVPVCDTQSTHYNESFVDFTTPTNIKGIDQCLTFSPLNMSEELSPNQCISQNFDSSTTTNCSEWIYDTDLFSSTIISEFNLVCDRQNLAPLAGSVFMAGMVFGAIFIGIISDKFGRKVGLVVSTLLYGIFGVACSVAPNYPTFLVFRAFLGAGGTGLFEVAFVISIELIGSKWRSFCGIMVEIPFALGELITGVFAYYIRDWRWIQAACAIPSFIILTYYWILPESVRWLMTQNKMEEATKIVDKAAKFNKVESPSYILKQISITNKVTAQKTKMFEEKSITNLLRAPKSRIRLLVLFYVWSVCALVYYGLSTYSGHLSGNVFVNYNLSMMVEIPSYIVTYLLLDKMGRKGCLVLVFMLGGVSCLISGFLPRDFHWFVVATSLLGKFCIAGAYASVFVYTAELFPTEYRSLSLGACSMASRAGGILAPYVASLSLYHNSIPPLIFGSMSFLAGIMITFLPETVGAELPQTLEESETFGRDQPLFQFICCGRQVRKKKENLI